MLPQPPEVDNSHLLKVGKSKNVFIIVMDMFQGYFVENFLSRNPAVRAEFDGFTYFNNAVSTAPYTTTSTRYILTGIPPHNESGSTIYINNDDNLLVDAIKNGYNTNYVSFTVPVKHPQLHNFSPRENLELSLEKYFQFAYKCINRFYPERFLPELNDNALLEFGWISKTNARDSFLWLSNNIFIDKNIEKSFLYYHNIMTHNPIRFTADGTYDKTLKNDDLYGEIEYAFICLEQFIKRLKEIGAFDDSTIIIVGDHGYNTLDTLSYKTLPLKADYLLAPIAAKMQGQYDVALMIKPPHSKGEMQRKDTAAILTDLRRTVNELMAFRESKKIPGINIMQEGMSTERRVTVLAFTNKVWNPDKDHERFDHWQPLEINLPLRKNWGGAGFNRN